ncbi:MAG: 4Fe-4S dicluster domain-containing protein [Bacteroidales bacterium]|nr:4Fe-4S dicluster domain-containing protein [Bacteroidales bacterium]MDZ4203795.1 4Fe-4S dicluster domain-containing protein [Bacteroidales bacterium]
MNTLPEPDEITKHYEMPRDAWEKALTSLLGTYTLYAPVKRWDSIDYELISSENSSKIVYNLPKPVSPLKLFLLPVKENVVLDSDLQKPFVVLGTPACDLWALDLLDQFYLHSDYIDPYYKLRRDKMILVGTDCHTSLAHCHCSSYGLNPFPEKNQDLVISIIDGKVILEINSLKGETFIEKLAAESKLQPSENGFPDDLLKIRQAVKSEMDSRNKRLPNYQETTSVVKNAGEDTWKNHSKTCVACGACATICPTCTCFLLIDRPGFEKVRQMDACQYPGFQRVAGGEDPHKQHFVRFSNRYFCKYVFRPEKFDALACTGCGRCIEACIGKINKNEIFNELTK